MDARSTGPWLRLLALLPLVAPASQSKNAVADDGRGWRWSTLDLELWIEPDLQGVHLQGRGTLELQEESSSGPRLEVNGKLLDLVDVRAKGATVELGRRKPEGESGELRTAELHLPAPLAKGARLEVEFECQSIGTSDQFAVRAGAGLASWVEAWYPFPFGGPDALLQDLMAASGSTRFHLPEGWRSVSNGERGAYISADTEDDTEDWKVSFPVARSFACAPYRLLQQEVDGRAVAVCQLANTKDEANTELGAIAAILLALERRFGTYPYPSYTAAEVPDGVGDFLGSSEQGFIMVRPVAFQAPDGNLALFAHELAHGWWGNHVGAEGPGSLLLDESLAQFSAVLAIEAIEGEQAATDFLRFSRPGYVDEQCARGFFAMVRDGHDHALATLASDAPWSHQLADAKGHWMYRMLRETVGDEPFFATLRDILRDFATAPLHLPELRARFERAAPDKDVRQFFAQWLDRTGAPLIDMEWHAQGEGAAVTLRQSQAGEPYALSVELGVRSATGIQLQRVELREREAHFVLEGRKDGGPPTAVEAVELDPRHRLLIWTPEYGPRPGA